MKGKEYEPRIEEKKRFERKLRKNEERLRKERVKNNEDSCKFYRALTNRSSIVHIFKKETDLSKERRCAREGEKEREKERECVCERKREVK